MTANDYRIKDALAGILSRPATAGKEEIGEEEVPLTEDEVALLKKIRDTQEGLEFLIKYADKYRNWQKYRFQTKEVMANDIMRLAEKLRNKEKWTPEEQYRAERVRRYYWTKILPSSKKVAGRPGGPAAEAKAAKEARQAGIKKPERYPTF